MGERGREGWREYEEISWRGTEEAGVGTGRFAEQKQVKVAQMNLCMLGYILGTGQRKW